MIMHVCNRCGKVLPVGERCTCITPYKKDYNKFKRDKKIERFRQSLEWIQMRRQIMERDGRLDQYLLHTTGELKAGFSVHHIIPLSENWELRLEPSNLITLSDDTHSVIEYRYKTKQKENLQRELQGIVRAIQTGEGGQKC